MLGQPGGGEPGKLPSLVLAYVGDAVYELFVRSHLVRTRAARAGQLHRQAVRYVSAVAQAALARQLEPELTEEEAAILRRGRNARPTHGPGSANPLEYRQSTGLESLVGYLYLKGDEERLRQLLQRMVSLVEAQDARQ